MSTSECHRDKFTVGAVEMIQFRIIRKLFKIFGISGFRRDLHPFAM